MYERKKRPLYSLEAASETAIDKLDKSQAPSEQPALSFTNSILANREAIQEKLEKEKAEQAENDTSSDYSSDTSDTEAEEGVDNESNAESDGESGSDNGDDSGDEDFDFNFDEADADIEDEDDEDEDNEEKDEEVDEEGDKEEEETDKEDNKEEESEPSEENFKEPKLSWNVFKRLKKLEKERSKVLSMIGVSLEGYDQQPETVVAYAKEPILEALVNLTNINRRYEDSTRININNLAVTIPKLDTRISNFERVKETDGIKFTNEIINDPSILKAVCFDNVANLRESLKRMRRYNKDANDVCALLSKSENIDLKDAFLSKHFTDHGDVVEYDKKLPGFRTVKADIPQFVNYAKTNIGSYSYYYNQETSPNLLYDLPPISITDEVEVTYLIESLQALLLEMSVSTDLLNQVNSEFAKFTDILKIMRVDVEEDKYEKLSEIGFDVKVKEFIIFKLIVDIISVNINIGFDYITGVITILEKCISFKTTEEIEVEETVDEGNGESIVEEEVEFN